MILVSSLLLAGSAPGDSQADKPGPGAAPSQPPAKDAAPAQAEPSRRKRTTSPPGTTPMPPMPNADPGIQLPPQSVPTDPGGPGPQAPDSAKPGDSSVKPVPPAPSKPDEPGVRPL